MSTLNLNVVDTNIILLDSNNIFEVGRTGIVCLPETTLDELDAKKSAQGELGYHARQFGRLMSKANVESIEEIPLIDSSASLKIIKLKLDEISVWLVEKTQYNVERTDEPSIYNDRKIIEVAVALKSQGSVTFISNDVMARTRALSTGLTVTDFKYAESREYEFNKYIQVEDEEVFRTLHNTPCIEVDKEYTQENYNYIIECPNIGQTKICYADKGVMKVIGRETESELRKCSLNPANAEQLLLSRAVLDPTVDLIVVESLSGSGKTSIALSSAMRAIDLGHYSSIMYIRNSIDDVDRGEEIGFLSTNEAKYEVYLHPLKDTLDSIMRRKLKSSKLKPKELEEEIEAGIENLIKHYNIEATIALGTRGRTFNDCVIILDECLHKEQTLITSHGVITAEELEELMSKGVQVDALSYNLVTKEDEYKPILTLKKEHISNTKERMYKITCDDGSQMLLTGGHKLLIEGVYTTVDVLIERFNKGHASKFKMIEEVEYDDYIYTPQVKDNENYYLGNKVVSKNCQNMSTSTLQKLLTRAGKNSKIILTGSNRQIDNTYLTKYTNGLSVVLQACAKPQNLISTYAVHLHKVVRSPMAEFAEKLFTNELNEQEEN